MSMILYYTKLHVTNCNGPWIVFIKQNMKFNFQPAATSIYIYSPPPPKKKKNLVSLKVV
jgi:hypothetical protein